MSQQVPLCLIQGRLPRHFPPPLFNILPAVLSARDVHI